MGTHRLAAILILVGLLLIEVGGCLASIGQVPLP